mmetsp:Transcript_12525/g.14379  ORF Transcript_12525/g.14379 Transcript_12525/m.14379 type:complete len:243 (-) Transcript_12525:203-931(-)|eukprot:CAMPEP_0184008762 /NCGR_PEP_ID=MMETSP0954-20121128/2175_1 /TAXON_ID=627963 /ORGANISM="Aplanochytrium sp, Strain PBS07" /LENGTH=242 /DNA_ID=CAMNT_0026287951 /DNA_START=544 /DNA_END=1272 /DNA_ORIENTATION=+
MSPASSRERVKKLWFVRHCQGLHNIDDDFDIKDPHLTEKGRKNAATISNDAILREPLGSDQSKRAQLIVTSPLTRCIETAVIAFSDYDIPIVPCDLVQESYAGFRPCDTGKPKSDLEVDFGDTNVDFTDLAEDWFDIDPEISRYDHIREPALKKRLKEFIKWLDEREEERIIIVGHKGVFRRMFPMPHYPLFKNGEVRLYPIDFNQTIDFPIKLASMTRFKKTTDSFRKKVAPEEIIPIKVS